MEAVLGDSVPEPHGADSRETPAWQPRSLGHRGREFDIAVDSLPEQLIVQLEK